MSDLPVSHDSEATDVRIFVLADFLCAASDSRRGFLKLPAFEVGGRVVSGVPLLHETQRHKLEDADRVWEEVDDGGLIVSDDLHPTVVSVLGGSTPHGAARRIPALHLSELGKRMINGKLARPEGNPREWSAEILEHYGTETGLRLGLNKSARDRLGRGIEQILITVADVIVLFPSQLGLLLVELEIAGTQISPAMVQEALHILTNQDRHGECSLGATAPPRKPLQRETAGTLTNLLRAAMPVRFDTWNRLYTFTVLISPFLPGGGTTDEFLGVRLARRYTNAYHLTHVQTAEITFQPFNDLLHTYALEGASLVGDAGSTFLKTQFLTRVKQVYLLLVAMAYHEHAMLVDMVTQSIKTATRKEAPSVKELEDLTRRFVRFRLRFRLPIVSDIDMHNQAYMLLRQSLKNDLMVKKIADDAIGAGDLIVNRRVGFLQAYGLPVAVASCIAGSVVTDTSLVDVFGLKDQYRGIWVYGFAMFLLISVLGVILIKLMSHLTDVRFAGRPRIKLISYLTDLPYIRDLRNMFKTKTR